MNRPIGVSLLLAIFTCSVCLASEGELNDADAVGQALVTVQQAESVTHVKVGDVRIRETSEAVRDARAMRVEDSDVVLAVWREGADEANTTSMQAISLDGGETFTPAEPISYDLCLRAGRFDPLKQAAPSSLRSAAGDLYIVQFVVQPLEAIQNALIARGAKVRRYVHRHAMVVEMTPAVRAEVEALPYVRWVGSFAPEYRLADHLRTAMAGGAVVSDGKFGIQLLVDDQAAREAVAARVTELGGVVTEVPDLGTHLEFEAPGGVLADLTAMDEVGFIDEVGEPVALMNNARAIGGANYIENVAGYTGAGVRGEVMDNGCQTDHPAYGSRLTVRRTGFGVETHGTSTFGINFGDGTGSSTGRGMLPDAQGIFSVWGPSSRTSDTASLVASPYFCVYQSNSWGTSNGTSFSYEYNTAAADLDQAVFLHDIVICQGQGNYRFDGSLREAWAKNVVSVGGVHHRDTLTKNDDFWRDASEGPAGDGRIKPDLAHFYDYIRTTTTGSGYTSSFGGTSGATPIVAGHFGLFHQMWADGIFGNAVGSGTVFQERPHNTTARAMIINNASQYSFVGASANLNRIHQGWGLPDLQRIYDLRNNMTVIDESVVLPPLQSASFTRTFASGAPNHDQLRATLVFNDPQGNVSSSIDRINDLSLKVTSPSGLVYWGNHGLMDGNWSTSGGGADTLDTVENVFIDNPQSGSWVIEVIASEVNQDGHTETGAMDADFALVITGGSDCPLPIFTQQPASISVCEGGSTVLTAAVTDADYYQWYKDGELMTGETGPTLDISPFDSLVDAGEYQVEVGNGCGQNYSSVASVSLKDPPAIATQPASTVNVCADGTAVVSVTASGGSPLTYDWRLDGVSLGAANSATLALAPPHDAAALENGEITVVISNSCGQVESTGTHLNLIVGFMQQPEDACVDENGRLELTATANSAVGWEWYRDGTRLVQRVGSETDVLVVDPFTAADAGEYWAIAYTFGTNACDVESEHVTVSSGPCINCGVAGDMDGDGDVDLRDMAAITACFHADGTLDAVCVCADADSDADLDVADWATMSIGIDGPAGQ